MNRIACILLCAVLTAGPAAAAGKGPVVLSLELAPSQVAPGQYPDVTATIAASGRELTEVTIVASVVRPDHVVKSWQRKKVAVAPGKKETMILPREYDTRLAGTYRIDFVLYSADMNRRFDAVSRTFTVGEQPVAGKKPSREALPALKGKVTPTAPGQEPSWFGVGAYGNTFNPGAGATFLFWPSRFVGIQGMYTVGVFTSYEGRVLLRLETGSGVNPYAGASYVHVSRTVSVLGADTTFEDSKPGGVVGAEFLITKNLRGYAELSGAGIKLERDVTSNGQNAHATVKYVPVSIGLGLVWMLF